MIYRKSQTLGNTTKDNSSLSTYHKKHRKMKDAMARKSRNNNHRNNKRK